MFDGTSDVVGGGGNMFAAYQPIVVSRLATSSPLIMNTGFTAIGNNISLSTTILVDEAIANTNNQLHIFVCQEGYHGQSNMVVDVLDPEPFTLNTVGQTTIVNRDFILDAAFNVDDLRIVVLVQNSTTKKILQSSLATADYAGSLIVDIDPAGVDAPWHLQGPEGLDFTSSGETSLNLYLTGEYTLTFLDVPVWTMPSPNPQVQTLIDGEVITFTGLFTDGPFEAVTTGPIADTGLSQGAGLIDFDNDGDLDIHVVNNGSSDQLLRNDGSFSFTNVAAGTVADAGAGSSGAWADLNLDGNLDLFLGRSGETNLLMLGDGLGGFLLATAYGLDDVEETSTVCLADFDLSGTLDIYSTNKTGPNRQLSSSGDLGGGLFLLNTITGEASSSSNSNGVNWIDLDNDRHPELYLANNSNPNELIRYSTYGYFDFTSPQTANNPGQSYGSTWGDFDNDGDLDVFVSNDGEADQLYRNLGDFQFAKVDDPATKNTGHGRGTVWADFNNDTFLDLYIVRNGELDLFLLGDGLGNFTAVPIGPAEAGGQGNGVACGDIDQDGDIDLFITREGEGNAILKNTLDQGNNFFELTLIGSTPNPDAIGAVVHLVTGSTTQRRQISSGNGYLCVDSSTLHFGLGEATTVDEIEILWPDGTSQIITNLAGNQFMEVTEGGAISPVEEGQTPIRTTVLGQAHPNPFNPSTTIGFALAQSGPTHLDIFTVDGRLVRTLVDDNLAAGDHSVTWTGIDSNGRAMASGTYFYRLTAADGSRQTGRMALIK